MKRKEKQVKELGAEDHCSWHASHRFPTDPFQVEKEKVLDGMNSPRYFWGETGGFPSLLFLFPAFSRSCAQQSKSQDVKRFYEPPDSDSFLKSAS